jgi:hypothetical protein
MVDINTMVNVGIFIFFAAVVTFGATFTFMFVKKNKKYAQFVCVIWRKDGFGQLVQESDRAGVFVDKVTNNKRLYLKKANVGLDPDNIPYLSAGRSKFVYLYRTGLKNFRYIQPVITDKYVSLKVGEEDVNWALNDYERVKKAFAKKDVLKEMLPYIVFSLLIIAFLVMVVFILKKFDVLVAVSENLKTVASSLAQANSGTTVLQ